MDQFDIILNVRGSHVEGDEENTLELFTEGLLTRENGTYIIEYDESEISGMENTKTRLTINGDNVSLKRMGMLETEFVFSKKQMYEAAYKTPYGMMQMTVLPTQVMSDLSDEKGHIDLEYVINVGEQSAINRLNIDYKLRS